MESYNLAAITKRIIDSRLNFYTTKTLKDIIGAKKESTFYNIIRRLIRADVLSAIEKGKYMLSSTSPHDFQIANFIYTPSYISFESALNFYGILSQFPYEVTSATSAKSKQKKTFNKIYSFVHIDKQLFWGYEKSGGFLIATPEKALVDQLYLSAKGLKRFGIEEYNLSHIDNKKLKMMIAKIPKSRQFDSFVLRLKGKF